MKELDSYEADPHKRYAGDLKKFEWEGDHLIPMGMWFAHKQNRETSATIFYHSLIIVSLLGKLTCFVYILLGIDKVNCSKFVTSEWKIIMAKVIAIVFITLKTLGNVPKMLMLRFSAEYKNSGPQLCGGIRFPFFFYIAFSNLIDVFSTWVAVTIALSEAQLLAVFAKFAAILIFADSELILGTFATQVFP